ncbi:MAG: amidohydrolase [Flavobacteriaceae bacterium]|nr:amidohydrolase [Flavobacteriaceae bacterium]
MPLTMKIALVQTLLAWEDPTANRIALESLIRGAAEDTDLLVLPEMFTTGFTMTPQHMDKEEGPKTIEWMRILAKEKQMAICGSIAFQEGDQYYNRLCFVKPDGSVATYDKKHTFTLAGEDKVYTAGTERLVLEYKGFRICPLVCYDLRFPVWSRNTEDYDLLIYVANWPAPRTSAWDILLKARAVENMAFCAGVNRIGTDHTGHEYSGHTAVYDALGSPLAYTEKETVLYATLNKEELDEVRGKLKFLQDRDSFTLLP